MTQLRNQDWLTGDGRRLGSRRLFAVRHETQKSFHRTVNQRQDNLKCVQIVTGQWQANAEQEALNLDRHPRLGAS